ncbi:MAG: GNAT family N-acetyltransferase [Pseudomonadota bacterium]
MPDVTTFYLEMLSPEEHLNKKAKPDALDVLEAEVKDYRFNRFLYEFVGAQWGWVDKLKQSDEEWASYAESDNLRTWVAYSRGSIAGYYELQQQAAGDVEICYLGLAPKFFGCGLGSYLLSHAIDSAWDWEGARRVWLHTCTLDHESALPNYKKRGFKLYRTETDS